MTRTTAQSERAGQALALVESLQRRFVSGLQAISGDTFEAVEWLRDGGRHGGGVRWQVGDTATFNRGSVNVSQVHYDDAPDKRLASATALSTIIHPDHPHAASMHMHISWTELRDGSGSWRIMGDLNPSIPQTAPKAAFDAAMRDAAGPLWAAGSVQGDKYFEIPALHRRRGVSHFYLEGYRTADAAADRALAERFGTAVIDTYCRELAASLQRHGAPTDEERQRQLHYHSVYLLQVLTLDRGTSSGLLIHGDNDVGVMGSIPARVDRELIASWVPALPSPQDELLQRIVEALPTAVPCVVDGDTKRRLAEVVRSHYRAHPEALQLQATGHTVPDTEGNHR